MDTVSLDPTTLLNPAVDPNGDLRSDGTSRTRKYLVFTLGKLNLAFDVDHVEKIVNYLPIHNSGTTAIGLIHLEDRSVTVIDLHRQLFKVSQPPTTKGRLFLILFKNRLGESLGLLVNETPTLMDIPLPQIRVLPESYRRNDTLACASHVMIIQEKEQSFTVFALDPDRLIPLGH